MKPRRILPPTYLLLSIIAMIILRVLYPGTRIIPGFWSLLGIVPLGLGAALNLVADRAFQTAHTTVKPFEESSALITSGVYRISRNPMYLGFILILVGIGALMSALTPFFVIPAFAILLDRMFIAVEEKMLEEKFGGKWKQYQESTRRWL